MSTGAAQRCGAEITTEEGRGGRPSLGQLSHKQHRRQPGQEVIHLRCVQTLPAELPGHQVPSPPSAQPGVSLQACGTWLTSRARCQEAVWGALGCTSPETLLGSGPSGRWGHTGPRSLLGSHLPHHEAGVENQGDFLAVLSSATGFCHPTVNPRQ